MSKGQISPQSEYEIVVLSSEILTRGQLVHLGLVHPQRRAVCYVIPMNYGYSPAERCLFVHAGPHDESLKLKALRKAAARRTDVCFQVETDVQVLPMAGGTPCLSTTRYCSVLGYGKVKLLTEHSKKVQALQCLFRQSTGLGTGSCPDLEDEYVQQLVIVRLKITEVSVRRHGYEPPLFPPVPPLTADG